MSTQNKPTRWIATLNGAGQGLIYSDTGADVAICFDPKDAKLIAAAPELLEALNDLLTVTMDQKRAEGYELMPEELQAETKARSVIAKATGGE